MNAPLLVDGPDAVRKEYSIVHNEYNTKIPISHVYKQTLLSRFNFMKSYKTKVVENKYNSGRTSKDVYLLSRDDIRNYLSKSYKFLHIGLVQFSITHTSYNQESFPLSVCLIDSKHQSIEESILVSINTDLHLDALEFNWFPNFSSSLSDLTNSNGLVVTINSSSSENFKFDYKVYYKLMKKSLKPGYLFKNPIIEVNTKNVHVVIPTSDSQT
ncbi:hypothetical protein KIW84_034963 [Lathyrus oleraceus]|uniref:Uncharacterized protein n=1 Tax=Pisum sativum TaxID=3888 RepID=A0A9D4Y001_PEA|nr:hypothetical protein KIW84_034963 [Pisum sativum]